MSAHSPAPWVAANMVHAERGDAMTPDEIGQYVANSVRKSIEDGGATDRFLFITGVGDDAPDICLVGNGPRGPANARLIALAPDLLAALKSVLHAYSMGPIDCAALYGPEADLREIERSATAQANDVIANAEGSEFR